MKKIFYSFVLLGCLESASAMKNPMDSECSDQSATQLSILSLQSAVAVPVNMAINHFEEQLDTYAGLFQTGEIFHNTLVSLIEKSNRRMVESIIAAAGMGYRERLERSTEVNGGLVKEHQKTEALVQELNEKTADLEGHISTSSQYLKTGVEASADQIAYRLTANTEFGDFTIDDSYIDCDNPQ